MTGADRVIKWSTSRAVVDVAAVAAVASYEHAYGAGAGAWRGWLDGSPGPVHGRRADLRKFDGAA